MSGLEVFRAKTIARGLILESDLRRLLPMGDDAVIFDVGANVGQTTERFLTAFPTSLVYAFEPVADTFMLLEARARGWSNARVNAVALGERNGKARMHLAARSGWNHIVTNSDPCTAYHGSGEVTMRRLDSFCQEERIDHIHFLKTDCEGYDLQVLKGAGEMLAEQRVDCVYCEVNFRRDGRHGDFFEIDAFLRPFGFAFYALYDYSGWQYNVATDGFSNALWVHSCLLENRSSA